MTRELWLKALTLSKKAQDNNEKLSRDKLCSLLNISDRIAGNVIWALNNRRIINCECEDLESGTQEIELSFGDLHVPFHDELCLDVILSEARRIKPTIITLMGDMLDFYQISTFTKNPTRSKRLFEEIKQLRGILRQIRAEYPNARIIYYQGNHEHRLERYICDKAPQLAELVETLLTDQLELNKLNIEYLTKPFRIGKLWHLHGHEKPAGVNNPEYILNVWIQYVFDHFIIFHYHRTQERTFKRIDGSVWTAHSVGYSAGDLDYSPMNKWNQGFAVIKYDASGNFRVENKKIVNGIIY